MSDLETRFKELVALVDATAKDQVEQQLAERPGGVEAALDTVYERLASTFNPAKANGESGVFQYEVATAAGVKEYYLAVADGTCAVGHGTRDDANVVIGVKLIDMLLMATGKLSGQKAFVTGKLKLRGNAFFGMKQGEWFD
ncbi:SCP2 sterol-binding domain-containing protein [Kitasatospora aureofaciens]|uniref:SCP2 sterol-binding domain-containing protein n=1 Tax=Kitasatospora aureofaciens TaxID=1894 RepID=UPI001C443200|nr:SCP2 sterol-binding domain-containing protein [Kitasatospora aureofaciens]MBV6696714.1 SCP2 sterol-binding domain-containing protein [Kitasatospora aureofaciens]